MFQLLAVTQADQPAAGARRWSFPRHLLHSKTTLAILVAIAIIPQFSHAQPVNARPNAKPSDRPNIVLIMADDMGYECVGANGSTFYQTPNLDRLAKGGMRFEHAYSQPFCTPPRVHGVFHALYASYRSIAAP